jgi:uncharacterized membrane protein
MQDCYFHSNVPAVAPCVDCGKAICATCRDERGSCPSCRLAQKIDATVGTRQPLGGQVPPRASAPPPPPPPPPQAAPRATVTVSEPQDPIESRALVALGYPLWPLALLGLFDRKQSRYLKKMALQALGFNVGFAAFWGVLELASNVPILGWSATFLQPFLLPAFIVLSVFFGIKVWHGDEVHVPIISDWIDERLPAG